MFSPTSFALKSHRPHLHHVYIEGVLGTVLEIQTVASLRAVGPKVEDEILAEIDRLEAIFSLYQKDSEFNRWQTTHEADIEVSPELAEVLSLSETWRARSRNAFNPAVEALTQKWKAGAQSGQTPDANELQTLAREIGAPLWEVEAGRARRLTNHRASLNSVAKGYIIDRACAVARHNAAVDDVIVNIGGDLRHVGRGAINVFIADPFARADNAPSLAQVRLHNVSLATSGRARRGFQIGERWFSHVLDPRTGWPVEQTVSASAIAPDALTADVLATICSVMVPNEAVAFADAQGQIGVYLVSENGAITSNARWHDWAV